MISEERLSEIDKANKNFNTKGLSATTDDKNSIVKILELSEQRKVIENLSVNSTYLLNVGDPSIRPFYLKHKENIKPIMRRAIYDILQKKHQGVLVEQLYRNIKIKIVNDLTKKLHNVSADDEGTPITFNCTILAIDNPKAYIEKARLKCKICGEGEIVKCDENRKLPFRRCTTPSCKKEKLEVDPSHIVTKSIQTAIIQEPLEEVRHNSPVTFTAKIKEGYIGDVFVGQKKRITGVFKTQVDPAKIEHNVIIDVIDITDLEESRMIKPDENELKRLKEESKKDDFMNNLIKSYAPHIEGYNDIKKSIILLLAGGVNGEKRGDINIFLIGDPSMAKTELLKFGGKITQKSIYTNGKGASSAGLTIGMVKHEDRMLAQAGVYPLCNDGYVFVDEFDKMTKEDRSAMHEVLEQGTCSIAKAGINLTLSARTATLAAANPKFGKYDTSLTYQENIDLPPPILSRFDLIWLIIDKVDELSDMRKAQHVLNSFQKTTDDKKVFLNEKEFTAYINSVKGLRPVITKEVHDKLLKVYNNLRQASKGKDNIPIGIRQLEAMVRMSMAHAKLHYREEVTMDDVEAVIQLFESSFKTFGKNIKTGETLQDGILNTTKLGKQHLFLKVFNECADETGHASQEDLVKKLSEQTGYDSIKAIQDVEKMKTASIIMISANGKYRKV